MGSILGIALARQEFDPVVECVVAPDDSDQASSSFDGGLLFALRRGRREAAKRYEQSGLGVPARPDEAVEIIDLVQDLPAASG